MKLSLVPSVDWTSRNGNYITVNYNTLGQITSVTDTLGRVITFNYDGNANLLSITQSWAGQPSHQWVSFGWSTRTMQSSFSGAAVVGTANGTVLPVITQVALNDTSHFTFDYTNSLQLAVVRNYFGAIQRSGILMFEESRAEHPGGIKWVGAEGEFSNGQKIELVVVNFKTRKELGNAFVYEISVSEHGLVIESPQLQKYEPK